ncbi:hypothetical protein GKQ38_01950 [Candidatus Nanohaloarchaea archaeon]|nr:hypothetical protein GKQ38_01950 [Candidatus Nanohaloarchaea archaeon]
MKRLNVYSVPVKTEEIDSMLSSIKREAEEKEDNFYLNEKEDDCFTLTWIKKTTRPTSRYNRMLGVDEDSETERKTKSTFLFKPVPEDNVILIARDRTFKIKSVQDLFTELFEDETPFDYDIFRFSENKLSNREELAEEQGIQTQIVRLQDNKNNGSVEIDKLSYSSVMENIREDIDKNYDVEQQLLKLDYSDRHSGYPVDIEVMLQINPSQGMLMPYLSFSVRVKYLQRKEDNLEFSEDLYWLERAYRFVKGDKLPKKQKSIDRFS